MLDSMKSHVFFLLCLFIVCVGGGGGGGGGGVGGWGWGGGGGGVDVPSEDHTTHTLPSVVISRRSSLITRDSLPGKYSGIVVNTLLLLAAL